MSTVEDVLAYARQQAQTDINGITDAQGLLWANDALEDETRELILRDINASQIQEAYTNIVAGQGGYAWPGNMFFLKTIEVLTNGSQQQDYLQATKYDTANLSGQTSFDWLRVNQNINNPLFVNYGDTFEILPTPQGGLANGIRIQYYLVPTEYPSTGTSIAYPQSLDYRALSCKVASYYKASLRQADESDAWEAKYQKRLQGIIRILAPSSQQPIEPQMLPVTGWEF